MNEFGEYSDEEVQEALESYGASMHMLTHVIDALDPQDYHIWAKWNQMGTWVMQLSALGLATVNCFTFLNSNEQWQSIFIGEVVTNPEKTFRFPRAFNEWLDTEIIWVGTELKEQIKREMEEEA